MQINLPELIGECLTGVAVEPGSDGLSVMAAEQIDVGLEGGRGHQRTAQIRQTLVLAGSARNKKYSFGSFKEYPLENLI